MHNSSDAIIPVIIKFIYFNKILQLDFRHKIVAYNRTHSNVCGQIFSYLN